MRGRMTHSECCDACRRTIRRARRGRRRAGRSKRRAIERLAEIVASDLSVPATRPTRDRIEDGRQDDSCAERHDASEQRCDALRHATVSGLTERAAHKALLTARPDPRSASARRRCALARWMIDSVARSSIRMHRITIVDAHFLLLSDQPRRRRPRRRRHRRARADQYRQDPSRDRAHARPFLRHHRAAAAAAGARGLQQVRRAGRRRTRSRSSPARRRSSRRTRASGSRPSRRCRAISTSPSSPSTRCSSAPISSAATSSPTACSTAAAARRRWCSAPPTVRPMVERLLPGAHVLTRPRLSQLTFAGEKKITRLPRRSADRRVLGRGGLLRSPN